MIEVTAVQPEGSLAYCESKIKNKSDQHIK